MIDERTLIDNIRYSEQWQNSPCPEWVIKMIESQPLRMISSHSTPEEEEIATDPVKMLELTTPKRLLSEVLGTMFDEEEKDER